MTRLSLTAAALLATALVPLADPAAAQVSQEFRGLVLKGASREAEALKIDLSRPATKRYAFVIGNGNYRSVQPLRNPIADAKLVADLLRRTGYIVNEFYDLDKEGFERAIRSVLFDVNKDTEVVFYFAGHGVQIGQKNFMIPVDADMEEVYDVPFETVSLTSVLKILGARARSVVAILDSCRDNPFDGQEGLVELTDLPAELRSGFSAENTPINSLLVFSTSPGAVAWDGGDGPNSPFTASFVEVAAHSPEQPVDSFMKRVRQLVYERTRGAQMPWESSSLIEPITFSQGALLASNDPQTEPQPDIAEIAVASSPQIELPSARREGEPVIITASLDPKIAIGGPLAELLQTRSSGAIEVAEAPKNGRLEILQSGRFRGITPLGLAAQALPEFIYHPTTEQMSATDMETPAVHTDTFQLAFDGTIQDVQLQLDVNPCDYQAGDHLDPEGVGVTRYPNEIEPEVALAACIEAVEAEPEVGRYHYQMGRAYLALRDFDAAENAFIRARDLGHTRAWQALGALQEARIKATGGQSTGRAPDQSLALYAIGADRGDPYAMHSLGRQLLLYGDENEQSQGFDLLSRSLELGHTFSMNALGIYFLDEDAPHFNAERGLRYLQESADRGDIYGYANMGFVALNGAGGTAKDPVKALDWFTLAAKEGHPTAPSSVGRMYNSGTATGQPDFPKAIEWFDIGLERGDAWGGANAAWIIANRKPAGFQPYEAAVRAAKAAALRNDKAGAAAREVLQALDVRSLDAGAQALLVDLGEAVTVDGAFGAGSAAALARVEQRTGRALPTDRIERLVGLSKLYWEASKFRVDLY